MRTLTSHIVNECNENIHIEVQDKPGCGGANHLYHITGFDSKSNPSDPWTARHGSSAKYSTILFQNGPVGEAGTNGITNEVLLAILIDRLEGFQSGAFSTIENKVALDNLRSALSILNLRTERRIARGVEGTHTV